MIEAIINSEQSLNNYIEYLKQSFDQHKYLKVNCSTGKQRSLSQNAALHLYCKVLAKALKESGITPKAFFKEGFEPEWNEHFVKDNIWRPVQEAMTGKRSTAKAEKTEYIEIYEVLNRKLSEHGIFVPWPSKDAENIEMIKQAFR